MPCQSPDLTKLSDAEIIEHLLEAETDKTAADLAMKKLKNEILNRHAVLIKAAYSNKSEPFGVINLPVGGKIVKFDTPKKVKWAQDKLESLWKQMEADGADPKSYIKVEYSVSETAFKEWGNNLKSYFTAARTVEAGNVSIKIEEEKA
jgi:hypothetical protein